MTQSIETDFESIEHSDQSKRKQRGTKPSRAMRDKSVGQYATLSILDGDGNEMKKHFVRTAIDCVRTYLMSA